MNSTTLQRATATTMLLGSVLLLPLGCSRGRHTPEKPADLAKIKWVSVAGVLGTDKNTQQIIRETLAKEGIICMFTGSVGYDVSVPEGSATQARALLLKEPRLKGNESFLPGKTDGP